MPHTLQAGWTLLDSGFTTLAQRSCIEGCCRRCCCCPAPQGSYEDYSSPPKLVDPFRYLWTKAFRMEWWRQQLAFMRDSSHELAVDAVYLWPVGSWDVAAIYHPDSKGGTRRNVCLYICKCTAPRDSDAAQRISDSVVQHPQCKSAQ